eukprot:731915-Rhodomonas_salina.1
MEAESKHDGVVTAAEKRDQLLRSIRQDPEIANEAFPFWPTLFNADQLMEIALEIEGTADDSALGDEARARTFLAASGLNPNLPWEDWLNGGDGADPDNAAGEAMLRQEQER